MPTRSAAYRLALAIASMLLIAFALVGPARAQVRAPTDAAQRWLADHPRLRVVLVRDMAPLYDAGDAMHGPQGFGIDLLALVAQRAGLALDFHAVDTGMQAMAEIQAGRADITPMATPTERQLQAFAFPGAFIPAEQVIVARSDVGDISASQDFAGRRIAVVDGTTLAETVAAEFPRANLVHFGSRLEAFRAISEGQADLAVSWLHESVYTIEANLLANLRVRRLPGAARSFFGPAIARHETVLAAMLARAIASLSPAEQTAAAARWLPAGVDTLWAPAQVRLSPTELDWVRRSGAIKLGYDENFAPFTVRGALDSFEGLGADMLRLAARKVGLQVIEQRGGSFADVYNATRDGALNVVVGAARTQTRRADFEFIGPFSRFPTAMVMRSSDRRLWSDPDEITRGATLGLLRDHFLIPQLHSRRPGLPLVVFESQDEVLRALADGRVDAAIGNGAVVNQLIDERYAGRLRVTGVVPDSSSELYFAVPRTQPELARLLQTGFEAITPAEAAELRQRWLLVSLRPGLQWGAILAWAIPAGLALAIVVLALLLVNRRLRAANESEHAARAAAEMATAARGRFLGYLAHELRGSISSIGSGAEMLLAIDDPASRRRLLEAIRLSATGLVDLLETTLAHERTMAETLSLHPVPTDLAAWWARALAPLQLGAEAKGLVLRSEPPVAAQALAFDGTRLAQVLSNIVSNAIKFTPAGGVDVRGEWQPASGLLTVRVADTGPGISPADRSRLFRPYAQGELGRAAGRGAGLGLAISLGIVEAMGGTIRVECPTGGGTVFVVNVPLARAAAA